MKIDLAPALSHFVSEKLKSGNYQDASEVIRESLRRWKEQEESRMFEPHWLEEEIQKGLDTPDLPGKPKFWSDLRKELQSGRSKQK